MKRNEIVLSYINGISFKQKDLINEIEKKFGSGKLIAKGGWVDIFYQIKDWETVKIHRSGSQEITPLCLKTVLDKNQLRLSLDKKALSDLEKSLSLVKKQNRPFKGKYEAILAHWLNRVGTYWEVDKSLFRAVLGVSSGYKETDIKQKILKPCVAELNTLFHHLKYSVTEDSYVFTRWIKTERVEENSDEYPPADQILAAMLGEEMEGIKKSKIDDLVLALNRRGLIPDQALSQRAYEKLKNKIEITTWPGLLRTMINAGDLD